MYYQGRNRPHIKKMMMIVINDSLNKTGEINAFHKINKKKKIKKRVLLCNKENSSRRPLTPPPPTKIRSEDFFRSN